MSKGSGLAPHPVVRADEVVCNCSYVKSKKCDHKLLGTLVFLVQMLFSLVVLQSVLRYIAQGR